MEEQLQVIENFYGVYLLLSENPKLRNRTYIGFTVDPIRRLKRHNLGKDFGGAKKTNCRGPWDMKLIVHGFPSSRAALRFEWAWQHPNQSSHLKHVPKKRSNQKMFDYCISVLSEMLKSTPWNRLPLTVRWLDHYTADEFASAIKPPSHMDFQFGKVKTKKLKKNSKKSEDNFEDSFISTCDMCFKLLDITGKDTIKCYEDNCSLKVHIYCLANLFCKDEDKILPIKGECPSCSKELLWGKLIRKKIGCKV